MAHWALNSSFPAMAGVLPQLLPTNHATTSYTLPQVGLTSWSMGSCLHREVLTPPTPGLLPPSGSIQDHTKGSHTPSGPWQQRCPETWQLVLLSSKEAAKELGPGLPLSRDSLIGPWPM